MEQLVRKLDPLYARMLLLSAGIFRPTLRGDKLRMAHYPYRTDLSDEFGIAPHTDTSFLTLLGPNEVRSPSIRTLTGKRIDAPSIPGALQ